MYSGRRLWVGDDQADVGGVGGWMDRWVAEGWTEVGVSIFLSDKNADSKCNLC